MNPLPPVVLELLRRPSPAVVATVRSDGMPVSAAVWYLWDEGEVLLTMGAASPRRRQLARDGRFTLTVLDAESWYRQVTLHCAVVALEDDQDCSIVDRISQHYDGRPYSDHESRHAFARARVIEWNSFGLDLKAR
jgi:PPOX class probable F420-dependent enzyme